MKSWYAVKQIDKTKCSGEWYQIWSLFSNMAKVMQPVHLSQNKPLSHEKKKRKENEQTQIY